jgi:hypothetical protein
MPRSSAILACDRPAQLAWIEGRGKTLRQPGAAVSACGAEQVGTREGTRAAPFWVSNADFRFSEKIGNGRY